MRIVLLRRPFHGSSGSNLWPAYKIWAIGQDLAISKLGLMLSHHSQNCWWACSFGTAVYPSIFTFLLLLPHCWSTTMHHTNMTSCASLHDHLHIAFIGPHTSCSIRPASLIWWTYDLWFTWFIVILSYLMHTLGLANHKLLHCMVRHLLYFHLRQALCLLSCLSFVYKLPVFTIPPWQPERDQNKKSFPQKFRVSQFIQPDHFAPFSPSYFHLALPCLASYLHHTSFHCHGPFWITSPYSPTIFTCHTLTTTTLEMIPYPMITPSEPHWVYALIAHSIQSQLCPWHVTIRHGSYDTHSEFDQSISAEHNSTPVCSWLNPQSILTLWAMGGWRDCPWGII